MPPAKLRPADEMLAELREELARGKVYEGALIEPGMHVYGVCDYETGAIVIDPVPHTVEILLHESLHRRYPSWSERRVDREAQRLLGALTRRQMAWWYRTYQAMKKRRRALRVTDEE